MPPITLLPAAAKLLPVVLPEFSIMLALEPLGSMTEFLRCASFLEPPAPPVELFISDISPTLGSALEFLKQQRSTQVGFKHRYESGGSELLKRWRNTIDVKHAAKSGRSFIKYMAIELISISKVLL